MRYRDKETIKQVSNHQNKPESVYYGLISYRQKRRLRERWLNEFRLKVTDKIWWDSLTDDEKSNVVNSYSDGNNLNDLMKQYPGNIGYIREKKLENLLK